MHRSLMQFNACKLKMRIVAVLGERVSDVTQSCTSGRIMILVSQLLEWNGHTGSQGAIQRNSTVRQRSLKRRLNEVSRRFLNHGEGPYSRAFS